MGRSYSADLKLLSATYRFAAETSISALTDAISEYASHPLFAIGSGGSYTTAAYASFLHQQYTRKVAKAVTPLEFISARVQLKEMGILFLSSGGRNQDIIGAFERAIARDAWRTIVVCNALDSPLHRTAERYSGVRLLSYPTPSGKDGFLATNSLLAISVLLYRAYAQTFHLEDELPKELHNLLHPLHTTTEFAADLYERCVSLWERESLVVLHGPALQAAAFDLESKFTEAALGAVQVADYRNFAHGRHNWLAKRGSTSSLLALVSQDDVELADKTLRLIPPEIPVCRIDVPYTGAKAGLAGLAIALYMVGLAGEARSQDPGRPRVPPFGRKLYHLKPARTSRSDPQALRRSVAIQRKAQSDWESLVVRGETNLWENAYNQFVASLEGVSFTAVVLDYDGTLCDSEHRYEGINDAIARHLERLLDAGVMLGIATGRGKSVKKDLRQKIVPRLWSRIAIGYYNGADIGVLSDDSHPNSDPEPCSALHSLSEVLKADTRVAALAQCTFRRFQITVLPKRVEYEALLWDIVQHLVHKVGPSGAAVWRSSHSIDVLAPHVSKRSLVSWITHQLSCENMVATTLCIGDRGRWPGNDFELLMEPYSLSVDEVSPDPATCWNLGPVGCRGVETTLYYLEHLSRSLSGGISFRGIGKDRT